MITSIINQKGGTGKTTTTVNLASALVQKKKKVLVIDLDPQGNLSYSLGINEFDGGITDALLHKKKISELVVEREGIDVVPTDQKLSKLEFGKKISENSLRDVLRKVKNYDFILIDCPPSISVLTLNALTSSKTVIIPIQLDVFSIQGLEQIIETINEVQSTFNKKLKIAGILPVLVDGRKKLTSEIKDYVRKNFKIALFKNEIRTNVKAAEAPSFGESVIHYAPSSNSAHDYSKFCSEYLRVMKKLS
jgi:chromosome partitioning protein